MSSRLNMGTKTSGDSAPVELSSRPADDPSAICYQLEPTKHMLGNSDCDSSCQHCAPQTDRMPPCLMSNQSHSVIDLEQVTRIGLMITPQSCGTVIDQSWEAISTIRAVLRQQAIPMTVTSQNVFVRSAEDVVPIEDLFRSYYRDRMPATNFIVQPPCGGQALAIEAWAIGGDDSHVEFLAPNVVSVQYNGLRWVHVSEVTPDDSSADAYTQSKQAFDNLLQQLKQAGTSFQDVVRTWIYQGSITEVEGAVERYREMNRARSDFFDAQQALKQMTVCREARTYYPASTGIGMLGRGLTLSCMALQTDRADVQLLPLENPQQTSAFDYSSKFSTKSPKFSRAMAVVIGDYVTTWISGTASIVNSESVHIGDVEKQTEQTIENIRRLISAENFSRHGVPGAGAELSDLAKVRVYIKHAEDYQKCRSICERHFGALPAIYAQADVCRPDLLVEIEGVAFSQVR
ncbi:MAG: hypothetical protein KDA90_11710 [Planctomycetaceae bacterium]|nr:hypothetical protein [Planctomycetaceae bacterium]